MKSMQTAKERICLYFVGPAEKDRWLWGDRFIRPSVRRVLRGRPSIGGVERVFINLCLGLDRLGVDYKKNLPFKKLKSGDRVGVIGRCREALSGYKSSCPIVAGPVLMNGPQDWPDLFEEYPVKFYLQHCEWAREVYVPFFGEERCKLWPVGIDTDEWAPREQVGKEFDVLLYNKIRWQHVKQEKYLVEPVRQELTKRGLSFKEFKYGNYSIGDYRAALHKARAMLFLCEHESQGIAYQEALSSNIPVLAWDQGWCLDPNFFSEGSPVIKASSVPFWDERCGERFRDIAEFPDVLNLFWTGICEGKYYARQFILDNLTLEKCASQYLKLLGIE